MQQQIIAGADHSLSATHILSFLSDVAFNQSLPLALWRLPRNSEMHLVISRHHSYLPPDGIIEELPKGFLFAPFDTAKSTLFLPADLVFTFSEGRLKSEENHLNESSHTWMKEQFSKEATLRRREFRPAIKQTKTITKNSFQRLVEKGISEIANGTFKKVVPSRFTTVRLDTGFDIISTFQRLCDTYPDALVSWVSVPGTGDWLGATPEVLVAVENHTIFRTVALAGTQPYYKNANIKSVAWTQKEIEEQALVSRYIINCFKTIRLREFEEHGPKTVIAGNLMHLKTDFTVDMKATGFPQLGSTMLRLLHPTSAVCGMPLDAALTFLRQHEGYDREFYSGYLGPVNFNNNHDIFVNLRCMQIVKEEAILYAGAGVTADSDPEKEWMETEVKFETLLKAIF